MAQRPTPGDQICVYRNGYYHHGIYRGLPTGIGAFTGYPDVIHFYGADKSSARVVETTLSNFLDGGKWEVVGYSTCLSADRVVANAEYYAKHPEEWPVYDPVTNNCEHFANYCKTGRMINPIIEDNQVRNFLWGGVAILGGIGLLAAFSGN